MPREEMKLENHEVKRRKRCWCFLICFSFSHEDDHALPTRNTHKFSMTLWVKTRSKNHRGKTVPEVVDTPPMIYHKKTKGVTNHDGAPAVEESVKSHNDDDTFVNKGQKQQNSSTLILQDVDVAQAHSLVPDQQQLSTPTPSISIAKEQTNHNRKSLFNQHKLPRKKLLPSNTTLADVSSSSALLLRPHRHKEHSARVQSAKTRQDAVLGMSIIMVILAMTILWGKMCAILCSSTCLYFTPSFVIKSNQDNITVNKSNSDSPDTMYSKQYKKKVILEGLLERNHHPKSNGTRTIAPSHKHYHTYHRPSIEPTE